MASFASRARFGKNLPRSKNDVISQFAIGLLWQKPTKESNGQICHLAGKVFAKSSPEAKLAIFFNFFF